MWPEGAYDIMKTTKRPMTAGTIFKNSMNALMKILASKEPFYVRCIKPNEIKSPVAVNDDRVIHQISYLGLLENVRVRRAGFAFRQAYPKFLQRYKMINLQTWPNFRGSDRDGVRVLLEALGLEKDATYGKTKVFIQSPETIFRLEGIREQKIPGVVILLQKNLRGVLARRRVAKIKAALKIGLYYRHYVLRTYVNTLYQQFRNVKRMPDLGMSIPWPEPPRILKHVSPMLYKAYIRWRAFKILSKYPRNLWPEMHLKITALEALKGKREHWGIQRSWKGDYMNITTENLATDLYRGALKKAAASRVTFSCKVMKFNRHGKVNERVLVITQDQIIKMDPSKKFKVMMSASLKDVTQISLSPDTGNQLVVIHMKPPSNDLILSLQSPDEDDLVGELVGCTISRYNRLAAGNQTINVTSSNILKVKSGKKVQSITINARQVGGFSPDTTLNDTSTNLSTTNNNNNHSSNGQFIVSKGGGIVYTAFAGLDKNS